MNAAGSPITADAVMAKAARENFPVALRWLPSALRRDLLAIYGFARLADDLGDEAGGDRLRVLEALDALEAELGRAFAGTARHPLLRALTPTLSAHGLPREPFLDLIEANRRDQSKLRYATWSELADYCALSAHPVGRLVLLVSGQSTPERVDLSDSICSALQLVEHCQDVREDLAKGRIYLPSEELDRFCCSEADLAIDPSPERVRALLAFQASRTRSLLRAGEPLIGQLRGPVRMAVAGFAAGGYAALDTLAAAGYDPAAALAGTRKRDVAANAGRLLWRTRQRRRAA